MYIITHISSRMHIYEMSVSRRWWYCSRNPFTRVHIHWHEITYVVTKITLNKFIDSPHCRLVYVILMFTYHPSGSDSLRLWGGYLVITEPGDGLVPVPDISHSHWRQTNNNVFCRFISLSMVSINMSSWRHYSQWPTRYHSLFLCLGIDTLWSIFFNETVLNTSARTVASATEATKVTPTMSVCSMELRRIHMPIAISYFSPAQHTKRISWRRHI